MHTLEAPAGFTAQNKTGRLAGGLFVIAMATGLFAEFYVHFPSTLLIAGDPAATASNLSAHARIYRFGIANNITTFAIDVVLIWALYRLLAPVNKKLAQLALLFRLVETTLACVAIIQSYVAMQIVSAPESTPAQLAMLPVLHTSYALTFVVVAIFLSLGSLLFNCLLLRSRYIPRWLAVTGMVASIILLISQLTIILFPEVEDTIIPLCFAPIALDELLLGGWLLVKGINPVDNR